MFKGNKKETRRENLMALLKFVSCDDDSCRTADGKINYFRSKSFYFPVDRKKIPAMKVADINSVNTTDEMSWEISKMYMLKYEIAVYDMVANNFYSRPFYFASTVGNENFAGLDTYFQCEGIAYRLVPVQNTSSDPENYRVALNKMYDCLINAFNWKGMQDLEMSEKRIVTNYRISFSKLVSTLIDAGKYDSAKAALKKCEELFPDTLAIYGYYNSWMAESYYRLHDPLKAKEIIVKIVSHCMDFLDGKKEKFGNENFLKDEKQAVYIIHNFLTMAEKYHDERLISELKKLEEKYLPEIE